MKKKLLFNCFLFDKATIISTLIDGKDIEFNIIGNLNKYCKKELTKEKLEKFGCVNIHIDYYKSLDEYDIIFSLNMKTMTNFEYREVTVDDFSSEDEFLLWRELQQ